MTQTKSSDAQIQNADTALCETGIQLQSQRMEVLSGESIDRSNSKGKELAKELEMRNRAVQADRANSSQYIEE